MATLCQFVDQISASPTVAVDLNLRSGGLMIGADGLDLTPPELRAAVSSTLLVDGDKVTSTAYGNRTIGIPLKLLTTSADAGATVTQNLIRQLDKATNILRVQLTGMSSPVFFRTFRAPQHVLNMVRNMYELNTDVVLSIPAEPFAFGVMETVATATVSNDPINTGSNGKFFDIAGIDGDVETPLQIRISGANATGRQTLFAVRRRGTPSAMPFFLQAEAMTLGTDTATVANSANFSGAGNNSVSVSYATATALTQRLSTTAFPASGSVDVRGTYRVFMRALANGAFPPSGVFTAQLRHGARVVANTEVTFSRSSALDQMQMVDLGLIQFPEGFDPYSNGPSGAPLAVAGVPLSVWMSRVSGTTSAVDYLLFVPADDKLCVVNWGTSSPTTFVLDGYSRTVYGLNASNQIADISSAYFVGDPPMISPGVTNRITVIRDVIPTTSSSDLPAVTYGIDCTYWPRYLHIRPATT